jgi:hypothetical protein
MTTGRTVHQKSPAGLAPVDDMIDQAHAKVNEIAGAL